MENALAYQLIQKMRKPELNTIDKMLRSPYFNQRDDVYHLFRYLVDCVYPLKKKPSFENAFNACLPEEPFDIVKLRLLLSYLMKLLEQYLVLQQMETDDFSTKPLLLRAYRQRGLSKHFHHTFRLQSRQLDKQPLRNAEYHLYTYFLQDEEYRMNSANTRTKDLKLQEVEELLSCSFISMKLRQACFMLSHQAVFKTDYHIWMESSMLEAAASLLQHPSVALYYYGYLALKMSDKGAHFHDFKINLLSHYNHFPSQEARDLLLLGINLCIRKINRNEKGFLREGFELYRWALDADLLLENGLMSRFTYNNIAGISLRLGELDWAEQFLVEYRPFLEPSKQAAAYSLNAARLAFVKKDYRETIYQLQQVDYKDFINNMVAKIMMLKCYYELEEVELLDAHMKVMRGFLRRKHQMGYHQKNYQNIVNLVYKLVNLKPGDHKSIAQLKEEIKETEPLTERKWLLEKINLPGL